MLSDKRYFFSGNAVGLGAGFDPCGDEATDLNTCFEGSAALPPSGGCLQSTAPGREIRHPKHGLILSFESSFASAKGEVPDQAAKHPRVELKSSLTKLKVEENGVEIERLASHIQAEDPRNPDNHDDRGEVIFSHLDEPVIYGIKIGGRALTIEFDKYLVAVPTQRELIQQFKHSHAFRREYKDRFFSSRESDEDEIPLVRGFVATTIVKNISFGDDRLDKDMIQGVNRVVLPNFGSIFFGELYIGANSRYLSLLRLELKSNCTGHLEACYCSLPDPNPTP